ncbi:MAG: DUF362 domain-containing protein [Desulfopila sp.]
MRSSLPPSVALARCQEYSADHLQDLLQTLCSAVALPDSLHGQVVLLKPNLISSRGPALACTNPLFVREVALMLHDRGARVKIGDSPAFGTTASVMARHGMTEAVADLPVEAVTLKTPVLRTIAGGVQVGIAAEALECDLLLSLPKLKAHNQMFVTCAVKNFFGTVVGMRKALLHMTRGGSHDEFARLLHALPDLLPPSLSLVDGIEVMHISGPLAGKPLWLGCVGMSRCPVAMDTAVLDLLELAQERSPLWRVAHDLRHPGSVSAMIDYPLARPDQFHGAGFVACDCLNPVRFQPLRLVKSAVRRFRLALSG